MNGVTLISCTSDISSAPWSRRIATPLLRRAQRWQRGVAIEIVIEIA